MSEPQQTPPPQVLPPQEAKARLRAAIEAQLGTDWDAPNSRWTVVSSHDYMARLNKGRVNVDFYVDYFSGEVRVEVQEVNAGQEAGRTFAWVLLCLGAVLVFVVARVLGVW